MSLLLIFIILFFLLALSIPISISIALTSVAPYLLDDTFPAKTTFLIRQMVGGIDSYPLLAILLFVLSGVFMAKGGVSQKLFNVFSYFLANKTGGLPCAVILTCLFYGAISGSGPATTAAVGSMTIPLLLSLGYDLEFCAALVSVAGGLGVIIPPSIPFIIFGMASNVSVGDLFIAGIIPGILIGLCLMVYAVFRCSRTGEDKDKLRAHYDNLHKQGFFSVLKDSFFALLSPVIILGSIYGGITTPTEAAAISVLYSLVISLFIYKTIKLSEIYSIFIEAVRTYSPILFILAAATAFGRVLTLMQAPAVISDFITSTFSGRVSILIVINVILLFVGMVMDTSPAILILTPIFTPIVEAIGVNPIHFGVIMIVNLAIGYVTPPMGVNLFVGSTLTKVPVVTIAKNAVPFIIAFIFALVLITFIPEISLLLIN